MATVDHHEYFLDQILPCPSESTWSTSRPRRGHHKQTTHPPQERKDSDPVYGFHIECADKAENFSGIPCADNYGNGGFSEPGEGDLDNSRNSLAKIEALWTAYENGNESGALFDDIRVHHQSIESGAQSGTNPKKPFRKWVRSLRRRRAERLAVSGSLRNSEASGQLDGATFSRARSSYEHLSSSASSYAFVVHTKEASMSLASTGATHQKNAWRSSRGHSRTDRTSRTSASGRPSEDSQFQDVPLRNDSLVADRALKRRRILEELIRTEEGYISDLRCLINGYMTIVASLPSPRSGSRSSIKNNLTDIIELHEELLGDLHRAVPDFEYVQLNVSDPIDAEALLRRHHRRCTVDGVPEGRSRLQWLQEIPGMISEPSVAADVAKVFIRKMNRFFIYEEYGAKHEMMIKGINAAKQGIEQWDRNQRGLETWASLTGSIREAHGSRKAMTIHDLLTKPIQRLCKYPLLFAELLKITPVCDCPYSYMEIENALVRLREVTDAVNRATDDILVKATLEKTWTLQDRLVYANQDMDVITKSLIRGLGHIQVCGVLHVCWQTKDSVTGKYMICLLYRDWLCLATDGNMPLGRAYTIQACIPLHTCNLEEADNNRGLQCHTAPFSWKIAFECDFQLYEILMTACTPDECREWRQRLSRKSVRDNGHTQPETPNFSFLALDIKSLGTVFGKPGTVARRLSIRRATTVGAKSPLCQVILKNTDSESLNTTVLPKQAPINRSQSLQAYSRAPVLAPPRAERIRLESSVSDVWSCDILPFPGITIRTKSERPSKSAASTLMRKLSVTSLASTFRRRSVRRSSASNRYTGIELGDTESTSALPIPDLSAVQNKQLCNTAKDTDKIQDGNSMGSTSGPYERHPCEIHKGNELVATLPDNGQFHQAGDVSEGDTVESSAMIEALRASIVLLFEENKELQPERKHLRRKRHAQLRAIAANGLGGSSCGQLDTKGATEAENVEDANETRNTKETECHRPVVQFENVTQRSSLSIAQRNSMLETMCPLTRQLARDDIPERRFWRWTRASIFHRDSLRQSFRNVLR